jgi:ubiquinone/menaquinone biosynthesis C-methylase UbiE
VTLYATEWDYTEQARFYHLRPNYADLAIDHLVAHVGAQTGPGYVVGDIGAGTGNLTVLLLDRGLRCIAVEPNAAMRERGIERTRDRSVEWRTGTGEATTLGDRSVDWFAMGSSFNTTDRQQTLREAHRVLRPGGFFTCMWNHRDLTDPTQQAVESVIRSVVPHYAAGTRRDPQADVILESGVFNDVHYFEAPQVVQRSAEAFIEAWASVKNPYWDVATPDGRALFQTIERALQERLRDRDVISMTYVTRTWTARRTDER